MPIQLIIILILMLSIAPLIAHFDTYQYETFADYRHSYINRDKNFTLFASILGWIILFPSYTLSWILTGIHQVYEYLFIAKG